MQIYNNPQVPPVVTSPNFKAIKSVKCEGLYKEFPRYGKDLVDTFKKNSTAMEFCRKYDVDIVFHACKDMMDSVRSTMLLIFKNPAKSKFLGFLGSRKDKIELSGYGNAYNFGSSLKASTGQLMDYMLDSTNGKPVSGLLDSHIKLKEKEINDILLKKDLDSKHKQQIEGEDLPNAWLKEDLDKSINDLIERSK